MSICGSITIHIEVMEKYNLASQLSYHQGESQHVVKVVSLLSGMGMSLHIVLGRNVKRDADGKGAL